MILSTALAMMMQVGPNPSPSVDTDPADIVRRAAPPDVARLDTPQLTARQIKVQECIAAAHADADAALRLAQTGIDRLRGDALMLARECSGHALYVKGNYAEAAGNFTAAFAGDKTPEDAEFVRRMTLTGSAQLLSGDAGAALATYDALLTRLGDEPPAESLRPFITSRALAQVSLGQLAEAEQSLTTAQRIDAENPAVWLYSATLSRRLGQLGDAQRQISAAADAEVAAGFSQLAPSIGLEAGVIAALLGDDEIARKSFQSVVDLAPDSEAGQSAAIYLEQLTPANVPGP